MHHILIFTSQGHSTFIGKSDVNSVESWRITFADTSERVPAIAGSLVDLVPNPSVRSQKEANLAKIRPSLSDFGPVSVSMSLHLIDPAKELK
jgi:hypothetical protein